MRIGVIYCFFILITVIGLSLSIPISFAHASVVTIEIFPDSGKFDICGSETKIDCFIPNKTIVAIDDIIKFLNTDSEIHIFASGKITDDEIGLLFNSDILSEGEFFLWSPRNEGEFHYFCPIHPWMKGLITVQGAEIQEKDIQNKVEETIYDEENIGPEPVKMDPEPLAEFVLESIDEKSILEKILSWLKMVQKLLF